MKLSVVRCCCAYSEVNSSQWVRLTPDKTRHNTEQSPPCFQKNSRFSSSSASSSRSILHKTVTATDDSSVIVSTYIRYAGFGIYEQEVVCLVGRPLLPPDSRGIQ